MMIHISNLLILIFILCIFNISSLDILDISHFTYYYKTYHYIPNSLSLSTFYNPEIDTNITIDINSNEAILLLHDTNNNMIELDILNDNHWDEISTIKPYKPTQQYVNVLSSTPPSKSSRSLLQYRRPPPRGPYRRPPPRGPRMMKMYKGFRQPKTFSDAVVACRKFGAILASVRSPQQNGNAQRTCTAMSHDMVCWLGLKRPFTTWLDSKRVEFANWRKGEPNNAGGDQDCAEIYPNGLWNDESCEKGRAFICQKVKPTLPSRAIIPPRRYGPHPRYGMGRATGKCGHCGGKKSCESPCAKLRRARRARTRTRRRFHKNRRHRKRVKAKWSLKMKRLRKLKDATLKRSLRKLKRRHQREARTYSFVMDLLDKKIEDMRSTGQIPPFGKGRRMMDVGMDVGMDMDEDLEFVDMVSRCKVMKNYEICVNYHVGYKFVSFDVKFIEKRELRKGDRLNYRNAVVSTQKFFNGFNPIEQYLGYVMNKYELMGEEMNGNGFGDDGIYYFDELELDMEGWFINGNNLFIECSKEIDDLPFKMCMKVVKDENGNVNTFLYFEKDINDIYEIHETYAFQMKEYIDNAFENNIFEFNNDNNWDEIDNISVPNSGLKWIKKCSYKLIIAKVCIEQFDVEHHTATIKLISQNKKRNKHN